MTYFLLAALLPVKCKLDTHLVSMFYCVQPPPPNVFRRKKDATQKKKHELDDSCLMTIVELQE